MSKILKSFARYLIGSRSGQPGKSSLFALLHARLFLPRASAVPYLWLKRPSKLAGTKVCLFVTYSSNGIISENVTNWVKAWNKEDYEVILIVCVDDFSSAPNFQCGLQVSGLLIRLNQGYDFAAWSTAMCETPAIDGAKMIVIANDSVFGPLNNFSPFVQRFEASSADIVGVTESREVRNHYQTYLIAFNSGALSCAEFWKFWKSVRVGDRRHVIEFYELNMARHFQTIGLTSAALFPASINRPPYNPTIDHWKELIIAGLPLVKAQLLKQADLARLQPGWREFLESYGGDIGAIEKELRSKGLLFQLQDTPYG